MPTPPNFPGILRTVTLLFLALPQMLFFLGWFRPPSALVVCVPLGLVIWKLKSSGEPGTAPENAPGPLRDRTSAAPLKLIAATVLPALVLTMLSGAGGWGGGESDWLKHDTLLGDLIARPWPVSYQTAHGPVLLVYYRAFYLPAALFGKLGGSSGYQAASQVLALTTFIGTVLSAWWLVVLGNPQFRGSGSRQEGKWALPTGAPLWIGAAVFFAFSGLDPLGKILVNLRLHLPMFYGDWSDVEWWAQFAQYSSNAATLFWAPQHAFGGWLPVALVLDDWFSRRQELEGSWVFYLSLALVWSPFAALGLGVLIGGLLLWRWRQAWRLARAPGGRWPHLVWWRSSLTIANVTGALAGTFFALYLLAHFQSFYVPEAYRVTPGHHPVPLLEQSQVPRLVLYVAFVAIEFGGLSFALAGYFHPKQARARLREARQADVPLLVLATLLLLGLPWFHYGFANDLVMRGGIPALFVLQALLVRMLARTTRSGESGYAVPLESAGGPGWPVILASLLLLGGTFNVALEYRRHVARIWAQGSLRDTRTHEVVRTLAELQRTIYARPGFDFSRQYLGSADSFFSRHMARRNFSTPTAAKGEEVDF